ncbi:IclR family transcriptional regulator [Actinomycetospora sp. NBRC 106375]|uniref:IclR family transcriptional regulator n=1 Tax=Actinomycetospora sp. NBRC 106375 TaxID=3032207 RepID=UPI0024A4E4E3|nr:IclR family transcriptional regulator [Actinomycetospora sp. NBRC 106375]GLZ49049.1 IclR family transcriptional regulator [Actinomycetospora sp. NBRC 106375]
MDAEAPEFGSTPQYPIDSVDNALKVLLLLGDRPRLRLTDVSTYLGVATSTAHRLLAMLQYRGFVRQDAATRSYVPGPSLDGVALGILRRLDVRTRARPVLEKLNVELEETVHLGRLEGDQVHFIDSIESSRALRVGGRLGRSVPAHCTSNGKAMLATLDDEEVRALFPSEELERMTPHSIGTRTQLLAELAAIRAAGYATSAEESEEGVGSIAVALTGARSPRHAINASGPTGRLAEPRWSAMLEAVREAAREIDTLLL